MPTPPRDRFAAGPIRHVLVRPPVVASAIVILLTLIGGLVALALQGKQPVELSLSELHAGLGAGDVADVVVNDQRRTVDVVLSDGTEATAQIPEGYAPELVGDALARGVDVTVERGSALSPGDVALRLGPILVILLVLFLLLRHRMSPGAFSKGRGQPTPVPDTGFDDVAGAEEVTTELAEVVSYLSDPGRFAHLGARAPRGVLLVGPPGTGKTLLARAVAGEAGVPFFALSGSDFIEKFVGVGASRVRSLFDRARKAGRAIVFIDELDAVGKRRGGSTAANDERESTLNQLLVEMDGFTGSEIVVLAATNRPDTLDSALTRPGRFDRQIQVPPPDRNGREAILALHLSDRPTDGVDCAAIARRTPQFTGADLANLVNQASLAAAREDAPAIAQRHLEAAIATVTLGPERRSIEVLQRDRQITAWHEAGHTVAALVHPDAMAPAGVSIIPRGHAGGVTWMEGDDHQFLLAPQANAQLAVALAGRAAEELVFGASYSQGASGDLRAATDLATRMAAEFGMSDLVGPVHIPDEHRHHGETADLLRRAVRGLLSDGLEQARALVAEHRALLEAIAEALLVEESLDAADLAAIRAAVEAPAASAV